MEQVQDRLAWLKQRKIQMDKERGQDLDLSKRIADRRRMEEDEKQKRRDKKRESRRRKKQREQGSDVDMD